MTSALKPNGATYKWKKIRQVVLRRDGSICGYCGNPNANTVDHIVPRKRGGTDDYSNLITACRSCNSSKRDRARPGRRTPTRKPMRTTTHDTPFTPKDGAA